MSEIHLLPQNERELFFRAAIDTKDMPFEVIEKDYWVVWVLKRLFSLEKMKPYLTFKGGTSIKKKALEEVALLERVANHKSIYFASSWASYGTARKKTLKLLPSVRISKELERDYTLMKAMFFREVPNWEFILNTIEQFENEFNNLD